MGLNEQRFCGRFCALVLFWGNMSTVSACLPNLLLVTARTHTSPRRANATTTIRREYYVGTKRFEEEAGACGALPLDSAGIKDTNEGL